MINWRQEWQRPYESIWSIIEKIKIANMITGNELLGSIDPEFYGKLSRRNINKLSNESRHQFEALTGIDLNKIMNSMYKLLIKDTHLLRDPMHVFHSHLRYCKSCISFNYHSYLHQYKLIDECPYHLEELLECCHICKTQIYFHNIAVPVPYTCQCGMQLYRTDQSPFWHNWSDFEPNIVINNSINVLKVSIDELAVCY